jgi:hypothetical protein
MDISGFYLSDDSTDLTQWQFPTGTSIGANDYLIIWADDDAGQTGLHANFKLSAGGENVYLSDTAGNVLGAVNYTTQVTDTTYGRFPNGTGNFRTLPPTFNAENMTSIVSVSFIGDNLVALRAFPNPVRTNLQLEITEDINQERLVQVYDIHGRIIYQNNMVDQLSIETQNWTTGLYLVRVEGTTIKVIVE